MKSLCRSSARLHSYGALIFAGIKFCDTNLQLTGNSRPIPHLKYVYIMLNITTVEPLYNGQLGPVHFILIERFPRCRGKIVLESSFGSLKHVFYMAPCRCISSGHLSQQQHPLGQYHGIKVCARSDGVSTNTSFASIIATVVGYTIFLYCVLIMESPL